MMPIRGPRKSTRSGAALLPVILLTALPDQASLAAERPGLFTFFQVDQLEWRTDGDNSRGAWKVEGWIGDDDNKAWLKSEGEQVFDGQLEEAEIQALYGRPISDFFDLQIGGRYDFAPTPERLFAVFGVQGLAPYFLEVDAAAFVSDEAEVSARLEVETDLLVTQRLVLQPRLETNLAIQEVDERGVGAGLNDIELGLRLRYEIWRQLAPYVGVHWERKIGETAVLARQEGDGVDTVQFVSGLRFWF